MLCGTCVKIVFISSTRPEERKRTRQQKKKKKKHETPFSPVGRSGSAVKIFLCVLHLVDIKKVFYIENYDILVYYNVFEYSEQSACNSDPTPVDIIIFITSITVLFGFVDLKIAVIRRLNYFLQEYTRV